MENHVIFHQFQTLKKKTNKKTPLKHFFKVPE